MCSRTTAARRSWSVAVAALVIALLPGRVGLPLGEPRLHSPARVASATAWCLSRRAVRTPSRSATGTRPPVPSGPPSSKSSTSSSARLGVMFFADPVTAFMNLCVALRPGGRVAFICWQPLRENPWLSLPLQVAARYITLPPPPVPGAPGPFSFADPERVRTILVRAGFVEIAFEELREMLTVGGGASLDQTVQFLLQGVGPTSAALREADPAVRPRVAAAVRDALAPFHTAAGVRLGSAAWIVTARR